MRYFYIVSALWLGLVLTACTGTSEDEPSTVLVIAHQDKLSLLDTSTLTSMVNTDERMLFGTATLPSTQVVDMDVVDRASSREALVVLTRPSSTQAYISIWELCPGGGTCGVVIGETQLTRRRPDISLNTGDLSGITINEDQTPERFCPVRVQVSREGRYVAILNDLSVCGDNQNSDTIDIFDLGETMQDTPRLVRHLPLQLDTGKESSIYMVQGTRDNESSNNTLFFLESTSTLVHLKRFDADDFDGLDSDETGDINPRDVLRFDDGEDMVDLAPIGVNPEKLVLLRTDNFSVIEEPLTGNARLQEPETIDTTSSSKRIIRDEARSASRLYVLSTNRFTIHDSLKDEEENDVQVSGVAAATLDSSRRFIYFLFNGRIAKFDVVTYDPVTAEEDEEIDIRSFSVPDLTGASGLTWTRGLLSTP